MSFRSGFVLRFFPILKTMRKYTQYKNYNYKHFKVQFSSVKYINIVVQPISRILLNLAKLKCCTHETTPHFTFPSAPGN